MTAEPCRGRRGDVAGYALGMLAPDEATRTLAHLDGCATCRAALDELRSTAALLPLADPQRTDSQPIPPADLGARVQQRVLEARQADHARRRRRRLRVAMAAAAAAVLLLVPAAIIVTRDSNGPDLQAFSTAAPGVDAAFALEANDQGTAVVFEHQGLDPDVVYWLWLTDESGRRVSAGTFHGATERTRLTLQSALPQPDAVRIWVTDADDATVLDAHLDP